MLHQAENDLNEALSGLSSAVRQEALQLAAMQRAQHGAPHVPQPDAVRSLEAMGFGPDAARRALVVTHGDVAAAATKLAGEGGGGGGGRARPDAARVGGPRRCGAGSRRREWTAARGQVSQLL